jgi:hypothetical protein
MPDKILISFKKSEDDQELYEYLKGKSKIIGASAYLKQLLYEQMQKEKLGK